MGLIHWLESHMMACPYKSHFGIDCPGCGLQRSFIELLKGNLVESFVLYPALLPMLGMFSFLVLHIIFKFKHGAAILKFTFVSIWVVVLAAYTLKLING